MRNTLLDEKFEKSGQPEDRRFSFGVKEVQACIFQLKDIAETATKDADGNRIIYTTTKYVSPCGTVRSIALSYQDENTGQIHDLNYLCSIVFECGLDDKFGGVLVSPSGPNAESLAVERLTNIHNRFVPNLPIPKPKPSKYRKASDRWKPKVKPSVNFLQRSK